MTENDRWLRLAEQDSWVRSKVPPGWYPDNTDPSKLRYWNGRSWTNQVSDADKPTPSLSHSEIQVLPSIERQARLVQVTAQRKHLAQKSSEMLKEENKLRSSLEADLDPPHIRERNQERHYQLREQQEAIKQEILTLDVERRNLRPAWKNALEDTGIVAVVVGLFAAIFAIGPG